MGKIIYSGHETIIYLFLLHSDLEPLVELKNSLSSLFNEKSVPPYLVVTGDFNLPDITWTETGGRLISNPT